MYILKTIDMPVSMLKDNRLNPRRTYRDLEALADSLRKDGQKEAIVCTEDGRLIRGHRRARAARIAGLETLRAHIVAPATLRDEMDMVYDHDSETITTDYEIALLDAGLSEAGHNLEERKRLLGPVLRRRFPVSAAVEKRWQESDNPAKSESMYWNGSMQYVSGISSPYGLDYWARHYAGEAVPTYSTADWRMIAGAVAKDAKVRSKGRPVFDHVDNKGPALTECLEKIEKRLSAKEEKAETVRSRPSKEILALADKMPEGPVKDALLWASGHSDDMPTAD